MATKSHCAYCFECLSASFERRQPLSLNQVQELWEEYLRDSGKSGLDGFGEEGEGEDHEETTNGVAPAQPAAISRLLNSVAPSSSSSSSSLPTTKSTASSTSTGTATPASSQSSSSVPSRHSTSDSHPLFVTWNTVSKSGHNSLRGCIGTFEAQDLNKGLKSYALISALEDHRFAPIPASLLPSLSVSVTLLTNFSKPCPDPMDWTLGKHGLRISFSYHGRRLGATYLPDVAKEQGWTKEETIVSLMRKAGWSGRKDEWRKVQGLEIVRYEGKKVELGYQDLRDWKDWVVKKGVAPAVAN